MTLDACVTLGAERETRLSPADLLRKMDAAGVERAMIQADDRALAVDFARGNREMLAVARQHPERLVAVCTANPWYGPAAVEALKRALAEGARMAVFAPSLQGFILGDEILDPVLESLVESRVPIYVHTGPHLHATPWQLAHLAARYPDLSFIMGHSGATDFWNDVADAAMSAPNLYLESSFARPFIMKSHLEKVGFERGLMGSGAPRNDLAYEWSQAREVIAPGQHAGFYGETLGRLIGEVRP